MLNVVTGFGHEAGQALSRHNDIDAIAFTGSTRTGKQLLKDAGDSNMKRVWLEAGGKAPTSFSPIVRICKSGKRHRRRHLLQPGPGVHRRNAFVAGREHRR
ncbi:gamma-glutamyl-gamma-aminobutyraldehyde dehydrogenase [Escherichia coli]|uniref:Gamma-glutamyl-gamma-aminobutyraldehyde dehydrogenase n=1 Tax=Escherichia coli TaxID=562 RepID=A0A376UAY7_ECOLX|nr:gamma-glutamyl-gamma-aminobutyraldehyde dehydrogenase [Escherichia coli]